MRSLDELTLVDDPAWPTVLQWIAGATVEVQVLEGTPEGRATTLHRLQVTTRSTLGALAWNTGGLLVDHGWLRVLGGGHEALPDLATASGMNGVQPPYVVAAYDVLGGEWAINGGALPGEPGRMAFFAPDTLAWEETDLGHSDFLAWALGGGMTDLYAELRWSAWAEESSAVALDQGIAVYPFLWSKQAKDDLDATARAAVPWSEIMQARDEMTRQRNL